MLSILDITGHNMVRHYKDLALESRESSELLLYFQVSFNDDRINVKVIDMNASGPETNMILKFIISIASRAWKTKRAIIKILNGVGVGGIFNFCLYLFYSMD